MRVACTIALIVVFASCSDPADKPATCEPNCATEDDPDGDGYIEDDCAPQDSLVHPGATEICDGIDNDCSGAIDDNAMDARSWFVDGDADGYGLTSQTVIACDAPVGAAEVDGDCNDGNPAIHPGAAETDCADSTDYNCDGSVGYADGDMDGAPACMDCDDGDGMRSPAFVDVCDSIDNNCDTVIDNGTPNAGALTGGQLYPTIQGAIDAAADGATVSICPGTYADGLTITAKTLVLTSSRQAAPSVILSGPNADDVVTATGTGANTLTISKLTFMNHVGYSYASVLTSNIKLVVQDSLFAGNAGGAIHYLATTNAGNLRVINSDFAENTITGSGGAIHVFTAKGGSQVTISGSVFLHNVGTRTEFLDKGGAITWQGTDTAGAATDSLNITDTTFDQNKMMGTSTVGGGLFVWLKGQVTITDTSFFGNSAEKGGAITIFPYVNSYFLSVAVTLLRDTFENNMSSLQGSAIEFPSSGIYSSLSMQTCAFSGNTGGAAAVDAHSDGAPNGNLAFSSVNTSWGGEDVAATNNMPLDLISDCGNVRDVIADVNCP